MSRNLILMARSSKAHQFCRAMMHVGESDEAIAIYPLAAFSKRAQLSRALGLALTAFAAPSPASASVTCNYTDDPATGKVVASVTTDDPKFITEGCPSYIIPGLTLINPSIGGL